MENETKYNEVIDNEDIICPITQEIFHDPVRAADGFVYERDAITRWILRKGTSPFTRIPLKIDDLHPDDKIRRLAHRRRHSTISFDTKNETVTLPPLRGVPRPTNTVAPMPRMPPTTPFRRLPRCPSIECSYKLVAQLVCPIFAIAAVIGFLIGLIIGM